MLVDDVAEPLLFGATEGREREGRREREPSTIEPRRELRAQPPRERQAPFDPERFAPQQLGDRGFRVSVLAKRRGDAGFVHRPGGFRGGVGVEKSRLHGREGLDRLDDDRDFGAALRAPEGESLEAVEDFERVPRGGHAQRQRREVRAVRAFAAQRRERGPQAFERNEDHRVSSGSGRIWKSG